MEHQFPKLLDVWSYLHLVHNLHHSHLETFLQWHTCRFFYPSSSASKHKFLLPCHKMLFMKHCFSSIVTYCSPLRCWFLSFQILMWFHVYIFFLLGFITSCCAHWKHTFQYTLVGKCCLFTFTGFYSWFKENSYMLVRNPETWMVPVKVDLLNVLSSNIHDVNTAFPRDWTMERWTTTSFMILLTLISVRRTHKYKNMFILHKILPLWIMLYIYILFLFTFFYN